MPYSRTADYVYAFWLIKSVFMSLLVEVPMCFDGADWAANEAKSPIIDFVVDQVQNVDPLLMEMGPDLQLATCEHVFLVAPLYGICALAILAQWQITQRVTGLFLGPAVFYGMQHYFIMEIWGPMPATDFMAFFWMNIDYIVVPMMIFIRYAFYNRDDTVKDKQN